LAEGFEYKREIDALPLTFQMCRRLSVTEKCLRRLDAMTALKNEEHSKTLMINKSVVSSLRRKI
jgi:hypothetical protein